MPSVMPRSSLLVLGRHQRPDVTPGDRVADLAVVAAGQADVDQDRVVGGLRRQVAVLKADLVGAALRWTMIQEPLAVTAEPLSRWRTAGELAGGTCGGIW